MGTHRDQNAGAPVISIVTPSYNQGRFLAETIESVIGQEGDFSLDYLIMDGGSTDGSVAVITRYEALLRSGEWPVRCGGISFRWVSEQDRGQADALAKGFSLARGEILAWLCSDDTYLPGALQTATAYFRSRPDTGLLYGEADYTDAAGAVVGRYGTAPFDPGLLVSANIIPQPAAFFSRGAYDAAGGLDTALRFVMDYDLWIRIGRRFPCRHMAQRLATYRLHGDSKTVDSATLGDNAEESLMVTLRHFGWAPLTRVYTACSIHCRNRLPGPLGRNRWILAAAAIACTMVRSLRLNRGVRRDDLKLLNGANFRKLARSRLEIMTGRRNGDGAEM